MGVNEIGYRAWNESPVNRWGRWLVIATTGVRRTAKSKWLQRILLVSILPVFVFCVPLYLFEQAASDPQTSRDMIRLLGNIVEGSPLSHRVTDAIASADPQLVSDARHDMWAFLLQNLFRYPQAALMVLALGIASPPMISHDLRS
ncbi:MAG: hypothetical protein KDA61_04245, partial [Planctomycetales bacterium]|nr:hypothetical protein [Planctomycetales bacterium]